MNEPVTHITEEQCEFVLQTLCKWINICEESETLKSSENVFRIAVLRKLLTTKPEENITLPPII